MSQLLPWYAQPHNVMAAKPMPLPNLEKKLAKPSTVTFSQLRKAARACVTATQERRRAEHADNEKAIALLAVLEPLVGIRTSEELKALSVEEVTRRIRARVAAGEVKLLGVKLELLLKLIQADKRRNVAWRAQFESILGASAATSVLEATPDSYSYKILLPAEAVAR